MGFITQNLSTILVGGLVFGLILTVSIKILKDKKAGKSSCNGCTGCRKNCHNKE